MSRAAAKTSCDSPDGLNVRTVLLLGLCVQLGELLHRSWSGTVAAFQDDQASCTFSSVTLRLTTRAKSAYER